ncbi:hypothetical protein HGRIS_007968 [Hohenbuehelia grisea]|uniref:T6SS Phospholipase effector Tle1-like catalytic domain-containing protein n=1 Tax=Hohenbuehelia grisea TaxID=104357 RepID=A0ABR3J7W5_9AGAR
MESVAATHEASLLFQTGPRAAGTVTPPVVSSQAPSPGHSKSPRRLPTEPLPHETPHARIRVKKRLVICCDGTWQDGIGVKTASTYTNILRLARTINNEDERFNPPIPQIVFYQSGVGTEKNFYSQFVEGATGSSLPSKVEEAYAFIAHNYFPGDEIFLFGFSRGAYTARMVAMLIGEIGILDRTDMEHFADIFVKLQELDKSEDERKKAALRKNLEPWTCHGSPGKKRADPDSDSFTIKIVGVFDTVGSLGLPEELTLVSPKTRSLFGFPDRHLGLHIERAYQALALNEMRADFDCTKFEQTEDGRRKNQVLKQCWFTGAHTDIGGGYDEHDLADITLAWMAAHIGDALQLDTKYLLTRPQPVAAWGKQPPHDSRTGLFSLSHKVQRKLPTATDNVTHETIHPSVKEQSSTTPEIQATLNLHPELLCELLPLEAELKYLWQYAPPTVTQSKVSVVQKAQALQDSGAKTEVVVTKDMKGEVKADGSASAQTLVRKIIEKVHSPKPEGDAH